MTSTASGPPASVQEYSIRVPKNTKKNYKVMRFNSSVNVDFTKWSQVKMERENNMKEFRGTDEEMPKFGAGSEFGREAREEARRKKFGIVSRKYRPEDQPWLLKVGGKTGKKFKGTREGGVAENAAYYVFTHAADGAIEAFPLQEWYNFQPTQRYKALSAEEAEQEFGRRNKQVNYFSLMMRKRLRGENEDEIEEGDENKIKSKKGKGKKGELKISEMDDWVESSDSSESEEENKEQEEEKKKESKKKKQAANAAKKKKKKDPDDEAFEESDDGDEEGREVDYISDSSESASDHDMKANKEMKGVEEEDGLRRLLSSGEEDEEDEEKQEGEKDEEAEDKSKEVAGDAKDEKDKKNKKKSQKKKKKKEEDTNSLPQIGKTGDSSSDISSESSDSEGETKKKPGKISKEPNSGASSRSATPTKDPATGEESKKRKAESGGELSASKKSRLDNFASATLSPVSSLNTGESGITEDAVRRYLMRKPMTTTELLQKFKSKKTGLTSDQLVNIMTQILKRINPVKQTIKGKMYLSIKG